MNFVFFHLMPYRPLDFAERHKHRSAWVVLPNSLYDPGRAPRNTVLHRRLVYAERTRLRRDRRQRAPSDRLRPDAGAEPDRERADPAHQAGQDRDPRPRAALVNNPVNIAEEFAMLDNLSKGRIIAGFVRGIGTEYHSPGINPYFSHERFHEAHDLIIRAWTEPGPFAFDGDHFNLRYVNLWPRPYQTPHPPVWIPSLGSSETVAWAAAPERKYPFLVTFCGAISSHAISTSIASRRGNTAMRLRRISSAGPRPSMSPRPTSAPARRRAGGEIAVQRFPRQPSRC